MTQPKYHRVALAQLSFNPAYLDDSGVSFLHEPIFPAEDEHGLFKLAGLPEVRDLRIRIASSLIHHMSHKIRAVVQFAAAQKVELLLLPEYSIPHELLDECKNLSRDFGIVIVAGSHIATKPAIAEHARLGIRPAKGAVVGRAVCPVFLPTGKCLLFEKIHRSKWESSVVPGQELMAAPVLLGEETVQLDVMICLDAIGDPTSRKPRRGRSSTRLVAIPSLTPSTGPFLQAGGASARVRDGGAICQHCRVWRFEGFRPGGACKRLASWAKWHRTDSEVLRGRDSP